jgi:hypothetical protein
MFLRNLGSLATDYMRDIVSQNVILIPIFDNYSDADLKHQSSSQVCGCRGQESSKAKQRFHIKALQMRDCCAWAGHLSVKRLAASQQSLPGRQRGPPNLLASVHNLLFPGVKRPEREHNHSLETNSEFRNLWNAISKPLISVRCGAQSKVTASSSFVESGSKPVAFSSAL